MTHTNPDPAAVSPPSRDDRRTRIRRAICEAEGFAWDSDMLEPDEYGDVADAVLAALPVPVDEATVLRRAADALDTSERLRDLTDDHMGDVNAAANELRRLADEAQQQEPDTEAHPAPQSAEAPWPTVTDYSIETWDEDRWIGITYRPQTLDEARERRDVVRRRFPDARLRIVRWEETSTVVEADPEPAEQQQTSTEE
ncbi:hypothetical protein ACL02U_11920 [Streptomyces sp. MS06]|uniref:hypothetical protein n=1 Tax=Streptomyces sp. MS06 TaxID=3385974 RepID=UPI0039A0F28B